jgi:hypothetical protein
MMLIIKQLYWQWFLKPGYYFIRVTSEQVMNLHYWDGTFWRGPNGPINHGLIQMVMTR